MFIWCAGSILITKHLLFWKNLTKKTFLLLQKTFLVCEGSGTAQAPHITRRAAQHVFSKHSMIKWSHNVLMVVTSRRLESNINSGASDPATRVLKMTVRKCQNMKKSFLRVLGASWTPASIRECWWGHSWALGTSLESVAADTAAVSIHFDPF